MPPFDAIETAHFERGYERALVEHRAEIEAIVADQSAPSFDNTILAFERSGSALGRVSRLFSNLSSADTNASLQDIEQRVYATTCCSSQCNPQQSGAVLHGFAPSRDKAQLQEGDLSSVQGLATDQARLLEDTYQSFVRAGAALPEAQRLEVQHIDQALATCRTRFSQNVLKDTNEF